MYKIKYLITGHVFLLPENEANDLKQKYPQEYQILEKNGKKCRDSIKKKLKKVDMTNIRELIIDND